MIAGTLSQTCTTALLPRQLELPTGHPGSKDNSAIVGCKATPSHTSNDAGRSRPRSRGHV